MASPPDSAHRIDVSVTHGKVNGKDLYVVPLGATVQIRVTTDVTDEVHVHGYDLAKDVSPAEPAVITFPAKIPGTFEVELERAHQRLFQFRVT